MQGGISEALRWFGASWAAAYHPSAHTATVLQHLRAKCFSKPWVVYAKSPVSGAESTLHRGRKRWRDIASSRGLVMGQCPSCKVGLLSPIYKRCKLHRRRAAGVRTTELQIVLRRNTKSYSVSLLTALLAEVLHGFLCIARELASLRGSACSP